MLAGSKKPKQLQQQAMQTKLHSFGRNKKSTHCPICAMTYQSNKAQTAYPSSIGWETHQML